RGRRRRCLAADTARGTRPGARTECWRRAGTVERRGLARREGKAQADLRWYGRERRDAAHLPHGVHEHQQRSQRREGRRSRRVVVLRHAGIPIAFTDAIWEKYKLGEAFGIKDPATKQPALRNPFYHSKPGDILLPDAEIEHLQSRGGIIGVCNVALTIWSGMRGQAIGVD